MPMPGAGRFVNATAQSRLANRSRFGGAGRLLLSIPAERVNAALVAGGRQFDEAGNLMPLPAELPDPPLDPPLDTGAAISPWLWVGGAVALGGVGYLLWRKYRR